jgi:NADH-ubiquinone oxidoreductase chain 5
MADQQDMRRLGGLINLLPFTYTIILIGSLSLMAIPFMTGFYSKDLILESGYAQYTMSGSIVYWLGTLTAMITAFYSFRLISMTFLTVPNAPKKDYEGTHEQEIIVMIPLIILALMSIFFGYIAKDSFVGMGSDMLATSLFVHPSHITLVEAEFSIPTFYKLLPGFGTLGGAALALLMYHRLANFTVDLAISDIGKSIYTFLNAKWFFDAIINHYVINKALGLGNVTSNILDRGAIELLGPFGLTKSLYDSSNAISRMDTGIVTQYALYIMIGLISIILLVFVPVLSGYKFDNIGDLRLVLISIVGLLFIISLGNYHNTSSNAVAG